MSGPTERVSDDFPGSSELSQPQSTQSEGPMEPGPTEGRIADLVQDSDAEEIAGTGPVAPPLAIEMDFQKFEEMFCIDPVEEQRRVKAKEVSSRAKAKPKDVNLLDVRRSTNVSIGLSRLMKRYESYEALRNMVLSLDITATPTSTTPSKSLTLEPTPESPVSSSSTMLASPFSEGSHETEAPSFPSQLAAHSMFHALSSVHSHTASPLSGQPLVSPPPPPTPTSAFSALSAHPLFASRPSSPTFSVSSANNSTGTFMTSRSETPIVYQQHLSLDDLLTLEPLLPTEKERSVLDVYQRQNKSEFLADETEALQKLGPSERFMYTMSKPVFSPLPETPGTAESSSLQWANAPPALLKGGFNSLNLKRLGRSASPLLSSLSGATSQDEDQLLIDDYLFVAISMLRFDADITATETQVRELIEGCDSLRTNEHLKILFLGVLKVGNMLNTIYGRKKPTWQQHYYQHPHSLKAPGRETESPRPRGPSFSMRHLSATPQIQPQPQQQQQQQQQQQGAAGFRLHSLLKLRDVRSLDNKSNLMHYLANMVANNNPELLNLPDKFTFLSKLEQFRTKEILDQVLDHQKTIRKLEQFKKRLEKKLEARLKALKELSQSKEELSIVVGFIESEDDTLEDEEISNAKLVIDRLDRFVKDAQSRFEDLVDLVDNLDQSWKSTAIYFGEKSAADQANTTDDSQASSSEGPQQQQVVNRMLVGPRKPPEEIFAVIHEFLRHFREAHLQNEDKRIREKRQAATVAKRGSTSSMPTPSSRRPSSSSVFSLNSGSSSPSPFAMSLRGGRTL
ncbi:hypothetical protein BGZ72_004272 [Mortierella alpina]|nr:hypothetical protein BGZ72_004272 [Mortierella alpina]